MKEIPMLFSTEMVQALLAGRKTVTRRIADVPVGDHFGTDIMDWGLSEHPNLSEGKWMYTVQTDVDDSRTFELKPKYGKAGDLIWCRETWFPAAINGNRVLVGYHEKDPDVTIEITTDRVEYYWKQLHKGRMIPSIHMPKEAARIWLQVTDIRVERLQDITEEDAQAEGMEKMDDSMFPYKLYSCNTASCIDAKTSFKFLWQGINGDESWNSNPWVWVVSFKVISTTGKPLLTEKIK